MQGQGTLGQGSVWGFESDTEARAPTEEDKGGAWSRGGA